jgi:hypothetical protein
VAVITTLPQAARWVDKVGLALLLPKADVALPSLWEQVNGDATRNWAVRDAEGNFVEWTAEMGFLWSAKDELPSRGLACVGRHAARAVACVSPRAVPLLVAVAERQKLETGEQAIVDAIDSEGPLTGRALRRLLGLEKKEVERTLPRLHRQMLLTHDCVVEQGEGWPAVAHELVSRKWPGASPPPDQARRELTGIVLRNAGEMTTADLRGIFGWRAKQAAAVLDEVAESRDGGGFRIWAQP